MAEGTMTRPPPPPAGIREDDELAQRRTLRDYYIILRERLWIALPLALLVSLGYGYWKSRATPMYAATTTLQFEKQETIVTTQGVVDPSIHSDMDIATYIQLFNSQKLRAKVLDSFTAEEQKILLRPAVKNLLPGQPPPSVASMVPAPYCQPVGRSYLISVTIRDQDPEAAALVANRYIKVFMQQLVEDVGGADEFAVGYLNDRVEQLRTEYESAQSALEKYLSDNKLVSLDKSLDLVADSLKSVSNNLNVARLDLLNLDNVAQQIEQHQKSGRDLLEIQYIATHTAVPALRSQLSDLNQQRASLAERYLDRHPKMVQINGRIEVTEQLLKTEIDHAIADLQAARNEKRQYVAHLETERKAAEAKELQLRSMGVSYESLKSQTDAAKANYSSILDRLNQTRTTKGINLEKLPIRPLDPAVPPGAPYAPDLGSITRTCIGLGLLTFLGVAVGLSFLDDRIKSAWDIESFIGVNLLGIVPDLGGIKAEDKYALLLNDQRGQAQGVEPFLGIYSAIKIHSKLDYPKSLLVTSTIPGEGKTLVSSNLAGCFARHGKRTLLIDCDLRRPMLHRHFKQSNSAGLLSWFENGSVLEGDLATNAHLGIIQVSENLWLLTSGGRSKSPTGLLENPLFGQLLDRLKRLYDVIVVDSPPMGAVTDALLLAERTDEIVYVCRFNRAYRKHIKLYIRTLQNGKNVVIGIVLNGLSPRRIEYYSNYRYYRSYKKYYGTQA